MFSEIKSPLGWMCVSVVHQCSMGNTCQWNRRRPGRSWVVDNMVFLLWRGCLVLPGLAFLLWLQEGWSKCVSSFNLGGNKIGHSSKNTSYSELKEMCPQCWLFQWNGFNSSWSLLKHLLRNVKSAGEFLVSCCPEPMLDNSRGCP